MKSFGAGAAAAMLTAWLLESVPADVLATEPVKDVHVARNYTGVRHSRDGVTLHGVDLSRRPGSQAKRAAQGNSDFVLGLVEIELPLEWR